MSGQVCSILWCERVAKCRGWCMAHYLRYLQNRDMDKPFRRALKGMTPYEQIISYTIKNDNGCWIWQGGTTGGGYGMDQNGLVHRTVAEYYLGTCPVGHEVRHTCDVRLCVNPDHLIYGTRLDNMKDAVDRNRMSSGEQRWSAKITEDDVRSIRLDTRTLDVIANDYNISKSNVGLIKQRKTWKGVK